MAEEIHINKPIMSKLLIFIYSLPLYWSISGLILVDGGDKILVGIIATTLLVKLVATALKKDTLKITCNIFTGILFCCTLYACALYHIHSYSSSEIRVLISALLYTACVAPSIKQLKIRPISILLSIVSIVVFYKTYQYAVIENIPRGIWPLNAIPYANFIAVLFLLNIYLFISSPKFKYRMINLISFSFLLSAIILTDTRGTWLSLTVVLLSLTFFIKRYWIYCKKWFFVTSLLSIPVLYSIHPHIENRINKTIGEFNLIQDNQLTSSFGIRLQIWQLGLDIINENKNIIGMGQTKHLSIIQDKYKQGQVSNTIAQFDNKNFHNEFIDRTVKYGVIGLFLYLSLLVYPFYKGIRSSNIKKKLPLFSLPIFIFCASLSYVVLSHPGTFFLYIFIVYFYTKTETEDCGT